MISLNATQGLDSHTSGATFSRPGFRQNTAGDASAAGMGYVDSRTLGGQKAQPGFTPLSAPQFANAGMAHPSDILHQQATADYVNSLKDTSRPVEAESGSTTNVTNHNYGNGQPGDNHRVPDPDGGLANEAPAQVSSSG